MSTAQQRAARAGLLCAAAATWLVACGARSALLDDDSDAPAAAGSAMRIGFGGAGSPSSGGAPGTSGAFGSSGTLGASGASPGSAGASFAGRAGAAPGAAGDGGAGEAGAAGSAPNCRGTLVTCDDPPAQTCVSDSTLRRYQPSGVCSAGACVYGISDTPCPAGCANGACNPFTAVISAGYGDTCAAINGGPLKCWGRNYGFPGTDTRLSDMPPTVVQGLEMPAQAVSVGNADACAIGATGTVKCWGFGDYRGGPTEITALPSGSSAIACGASYFDHECVITSVGGVKCWGANQFGQLGNGATINAFVYQYEIADVVGLPSAVSILSAGSNDTCAIDASGQLWCWGLNNHGELGNNSTLSSDVPVAVQGLTSGVVGVSAGEEYTCALTAAGGVKCWGTNWLGGPDVLVPTDVAGLSSGVRSVSVNGVACALMVSGGVKCWGRNYFGQLGNGSMTSSPLPVDVTGLSSGIVAIAVGEQYGCAVTDTGKIMCWGMNNSDMLGSNVGAESLVPVEVPF